MPITLQWGHDFSAVEIYRVGPKNPSWKNSFNGATTFQPWKSLMGHVVSTETRASMGPRLFSRGNVYRAITCYRIRAGASMGPRLFSRGNGRHGNRCVLGQ